MRRCWVLATGLGLAACASVPAPRIFSQLDGVSSAPAVAEARKLAPAGVARAEKLRQDARRAHESGRTAAATALAEHSLAAFEHAVVLARLARAESRLALAEHTLKERERELAAVDESQTRAAADAEALELRVRVARDAIARLPSTPAGPDRERARLQAARALASQARLLCAAAGLLGSSDGLAAAVAKVDALDTALRGEPKVTPIDAALQARASCLTELTRSRRAAPASGGELDADGLLAELSRTGTLFPFRDDRGVVVTLRAVFGQGDALAPGASERVELLGRAAKAHPSFPLLIVVHTARGAGSAKQGERLAELLKAAGAPRVKVELAGASQPLVEPGGPDASARNARIEVVFVSSAP
ncbi:MAG: hypothetical protein KF718_22170 [Polyangiaceae bacterium]|nr:hypothetical protein [Polyangiaceae bacterium]